MTDDAIDRIKLRWASEGVPARPGNPPGALAEFEARYGVALPPAVRDYLARLDGTGDEMVGKWCFRFWPLAEVRPEGEGFAPEPGRADLGLFLFADHLIESFHLAVRLTADPSQGGEVVIPHGVELGRVAPDFATFLAAYLADEDNLFGTGPFVPRDSIFPKDGERPNE